MITQADLGRDLQPKIPDGVTGLAAFRAMVGSPHRTLLEHGTGATEVAIEDRMERPARRVIAAEYPMIYGATPHRTVGHQTLCVKLKAISARYLVRQPAAVHRCHEFDFLFLHLQR